jgi:hypothetical protein
VTPAEDDGTDETPTVLTETEIRIIQVPYGPTLYLTKGQVEGLIYTGLLCLLIYFFWHLALWRYKRTHKGHPRHFYRMFRPRRFIRRKR